MQTQETQLIWFAIGYNLADKVGILLYYLSR
jgi:hypothetical protein